MPPYGKYFSYLPTVPYEVFDGSNKYKVVTDIFKRVRSTMEAQTDKTINYNYHVQEGQLPEHVAYNYYGSPDYHWVVLLMNDIRDPQWCWPLDSFSFEKFVANKYGSMETASTQILHYETKEIKAIADDDVYSIGDVVLPSGLIANSTFTYSYTGTVGGVVSKDYTYSAAVATKAITALAYEQEQNDKRADIVLLRRNLLQEFVNAFENLVVQRR